MASPALPPILEPTLEAARQRLAAVQPGAYARTRNHLEGAVTRLSPYLTHGLLTLREVVSHLRLHHGLDLSHKLVQELGWRAWWHHAWRHRGEAIFASLHAGPMPEQAYARALPPDVRQAGSGVPVVDQAVRTLCTSGYLHNHARMWLASYLVHVRHVHWRAGADWMYAHLLDGDLASNHLSWQWIAGTGSHQPYLFNADNVARYAPESWHSFGTVVDASYEALGARAAGAALASVRRAPAGPARQGVSAAAGAGRATTAPLWDDDEPAFEEPAPSTRRPGPALPEPDAQAFAGREVWLVHPWSLDGPPRDLPAGTLVAGLWLDEHHARWPWSPLRWAFVGTRMDALTQAQWRGTAAQWRQALAGAAAVRGWQDPHLGALGPALGLAPRAAAFAEPPGPCRSFSQFWRAARYAD